jgi:hypothetical protein
MANGASSSLARDGYPSHHRIASEPRLIGRARLAHAIRVSHTRFCGVHAGAFSLLNALALTRRVVGVRGNFLAGASHAGR